MITFARLPVSCSLAFVLSVLATPEAAAQRLVAECAGVQVLSLDISGREAEAYCRYAVTERQKVADFWGATWNEPIRIHVDRSYRISRALVPGYRGNRGFMEMPLRVVLNGDSALLHEIVHIYAPNNNRFLAEGLAVYLHQKLAGNGAFPNFGKPLDAEARQRLGEIQSLEALNSVVTPRPLGTVLHEQSAYILAGSFVGFLIEKYGLAEFKKLYESGKYEAAYGKTLEALEQEWRSALQEKPR